MDALKEKSSPTFTLVRRPLPRNYLGDSLRLPAASDLGNAPHMHTLLSCDLIVTY